MAKKQLPKIQAEAESAMRIAYADELERLQALARVNPNVRSEEIATLKMRAAELTSHLSSSRLRLDAIHLIVAL